MRLIHQPWESVLRHLDGCNEVQPQQRKVSEVIVVQRLAREVRMHQPHPSQAVTAAPAQFRKKQPPRVAHNDRRDPAPAVQKQPHLTLDLPRDLGKRLGEFRRNDAIRMSAPALQPFERAQLRCFETVQIAAEQSSPISSALSITPAS